MYITGGIITNNQATKTKLFAHKIFKIQDQNTMNNTLIKYNPVQLVNPQFSPTQ